MKRLSLAGVVALAALALSCSKSLSGKYFHDYGPDRESIELKSDKTVTIYAEAYKDGKRTRENWTEAGTYKIENNVLRTHSTVTFTYPNGNSRTETHDYEWTIEEGALIKRPDGYRYRSDALLAAESQLQKLSPELTKEKAQEAINQWALPHIKKREDGKAVAEYTGPLQVMQSPNKKNDPGVFVWQLKEETQGHMARAVLQFAKFPTAYEPLPTPGASYVPYNPFNPSLSSAQRGGKALLTTMGNATFFHDSDGKWTLIGVEAGAPDTFTRFWNMDQLQLKIEIR